MGIRMFSNVPFFKTAVAVNNFLKYCIFCSMFPARVYLASQQKTTNWLTVDILWFQRQVQEWNKALQIGSWWENITNFSEEFQIIKMLLLQLESLMRHSNWQRSTSMEADRKKRENGGRFTVNLVPRGSAITLSEYRRLITMDQRLDCYLTSPLVCLLACFFSTCSSVFFTCSSVWKNIRKTIRHSQKHHNPASLHRAIQHGNRPFNHRVQADQVAILGSSHLPA